MLVPDITKRDKIIRNKNVINIDDPYNNGSMYNYEILTNDKIKDKFIKHIESIIRQSYEYSVYISIMKTEFNLSHCVKLPGLDINNYKFTLEMHHYPFTLYDLVAIEVDYLIDKGEIDINPFDIAQYIIVLHFKHLIGLVPVSKTVHELVHDGETFINLKYVIASYDEYINLYRNKIPDDFISKINELKELSKLEDEGEIVDNNILDIIMMEINNSNKERELKELEIKEE